EDRDDRDTADGRPATCAAAAARLARMVCADTEELDESEVRQIAQAALAQQRQQIGSALGHVAASLPGPPQTVIASGEGEFLALLGLRERGGFPPGRLLSLA